MTFFENQEEFPYYVPHSKESLVTLVVCLFSQLITLQTGQNLTSFINKKLNALSLKVLLVNSFIFFLSIISYAYYSYLIKSTQNKHSFSVITYYLFRIFFNPMNDDYDMPAAKFLLNHDNSVQAINILYRQLFPMLAKVVAVLLFIIIYYRPLFIWIVTLVLLLILCFSVFRLAVKENIEKETKDLESFANDLDEIYHIKQNIKLFADSNLTKLNNQVI